MCCFCRVLGVCEFVILVTSMVGTGVFVGFNVYCLRGFGFEMFVLVVCVLLVCIGRVYFGV